MNDKEIIKALNDCIGLQSYFNSIVNVDWRTANYSWRRAMWIEAAELADHLGYKWWKNVNAEYDKKQVLLEVVDIFHFILSDIIIRDRGRQPAENMLSAYKWAVKHTYAPNKEAKLKYIEEFVVEVLDSDMYLTHFFVMMNSLDITIDDLLKYYVAKNVLNKFRQANGYKDGTYQKIWRYNNDNVEDNVVIEQLVDSSSVVNADTLYADLTTIYSQMS